MIQDDSKAVHDADVEAFLRRSAVHPDGRFEADLNRKLFAKKGAPTLRHRWLAAVGTSAGLAAVVLAATLAGGGPLASDGGTDARARPGCTTVYVTKVKPGGTVVRRQDGAVTVETSDIPVTEASERCR